MYRKILLSVDLHDEASWAKALPSALELCQAFHAELHIVTVVPDLPLGVVNLYMEQDAGKKMAQAAKDGLTEFIDKRVPAGFKVKWHVVHGSVYQSILDLADKIEADLTVMASHRPDMSDYLLGPNAARVVRHATRSVLVVRG